MENETSICCLFTTLHKSSLYTTPPPHPHPKTLKGHLHKACRGSTRAGQRGSERMSAFPLGQRNSSLKLKEGEGRRKRERQEREGIVLVFNKCFQEYFGSPYLPLNTRSETQLLISVWLPKKEKYRSSWNSGLRKWTLNPLGLIGLFFRMIYGNSLRRLLWQSCSSLAACVYPHVRTYYTMW